MSLSMWDFWQVREGERIDAAYMHIYAYMHICIYAPPTPL